ncbi:MAG: hypothetical protein ACFWTY_12605 [Shouchella clausii]|jgi:hypothetical protein
MNRKRMIVIVITVILVLCVGIAFYLWNKAQQEKEAANRVLRNEYGYAAGSLHLDVDTSKYDQTGDPHDIELTPTDLTYDLLQRWESIAEVIPTIDYPEEAVTEEDWLNVYNTFASNRFDAEDASKEITKGGGVRLPIPWPLMTIFYMVPYTMTTFVNFLK